MKTNPVLFENPDLLEIFGLTDRASAPRNTTLQSPKMPVGIGNSKSLGMVTAPRLIVTEIVAEMITLGFGKCSRHALCWKDAHSSVNECADQPAATSL